MAREKRPAEKTATSYSKRQKISSTNNHISSPNKGDEIESDITPDGVPEDDERLTQEIQSKLDRLKSDLVKRNKASKDFEEKIKREQERLSRTIESATDRIEEKRDSFRSCMLPILDGALKDLSLQTERSPRERDLIATESKLEPEALRLANSALSSCSELIACYKKATSIPPITSNTSDLQNTFEIDKEETMRAFESAKKMTINQLQAGLADKTEDTRDRYDLDDDEYHVARKILVRGKGNSSVTISTNLGPLLYEFRKIVGKMQNMIDG